MSVPRLHPVLPVLALLACGAPDDDTPDDDPDLPGPTTFTVQVDNVGMDRPILAAGTQEGPEDGPLQPGEEVTFTVQAAPGHRLSLATMLIPSNDILVALPAEGLPLWDEAGLPMEGDLSDRLWLYDAGTEVNGPPGEGPNQADNHDGALPADEQGPEEGGLVTELEGPDWKGPDGYRWPDPEDVLNVNIDHAGGIDFEVTVTNVGRNAVAGGPAPVSPMLWMVHADRIDLVQPGREASPETELLAEAGQAGPLADAFAPSVGVTPLFSPGAWAVHEETVRMVALGEVATPGLESLAEDGDPAPLVDELAGSEGIDDAGSFTETVSGDPPPIGPGMSFTFEVEGLPGDRLSLATMWVNSNDWIVATPEQGVPLFDPDDASPRVSVLELELLDAGTEVDQPLGVGLDQAPRQDEPDTGPDEGATVQRVREDVGERRLDDQIAITLTPADGS